MKSLNDIIQMMRESKIFTEDELSEFRHLVSTEKGKELIIGIIDQSIQEGLQKKIKNLLDNVNKI
tara:strand:+ start:320 stop:514 length:195 start_codon:yes stop_codon:yes gene_type:complete